MNYAKDEEYARTVLASSWEVEGENFTAYQVFNTRVRRTLQHSELLLRRVGDSMKVIDVRTPSGIYLGRRPAFELDTPRFQRVMGKIARGLHFHETGTTLPGDVQCAIVVNPAPDQFDPAILESPGDIRGNHPEVFRYRCAFTPDRSRGSVWVFQFYEKRTFLVFLRGRPATAD